MFSVRWTGTVVPRYTQPYTFHAKTDDGVRLWIDGQLVIDRWQDQAPYEEASVPVNLEAERPYLIRMEFYERGGGATAQLRWSSASQAKEVVPQSRLYGCWKGSDQFVRDFYQGALGRQPSVAELQDRAGGLEQARADSQLLAEAQRLGTDLFTSAEYAARGRTDAEYISDLYRAYLQREPDAGGVNTWMNVIAQCDSNQQCRQGNRAEARQAFDEGVEFAEKVRNLCGTAAATPAGGGAGYNFAAARLDPVNRTGGGGVDPYSRNFNFSIPLVSLAGRAGLDLGLVLSYNSLVWTKDATGVTFDADQGFPSPGFRLGFPTVEPKFVNPLIQQAGQPVRYSYLLVTPGGGRVELRQVGASDVYEAADSSYLQLTEADMTLRAADGTRLRLVPLGGLYRCTQVIDRNGNYLTAGYYGDGRLWKVTDTLGRVITFNYDNSLNLSSLTQPWTREGEPGVPPAPAPDETHEWATFGYTGVALLPTFANLAVVGDQPGTVFPALYQVGLADGSFYRFNYNQWGQVWRVTHYAADSRDADGQPNESRPLTSTRVDLPGSDLVAPSAQSDCPRFTQERTWVENGLLGQSGEVTTTYDPWSPGMASCEVTLPDGTTKQVSTYGTPSEGWLKGLTKQEVTKDHGDTVRTATLSWEHDGGADAYATNPRVTLTSITDPQQNGRATRVTYTTPADFRWAGGFTGTLNVRLPKKVEECGNTGCASVLRTTVTDYRVPNLDEYAQRRVLGLASYRYVYDGAETPANLRSKVGYVYDDTGYVDDSQQQPKFLQPLPSPAWQHYKDDYGTGLRWRGNVTRVRRYEVSQQNGHETGAFTESLAGYNVTGATVFARDAEKHRTNVSYEDAFYAGVNRTSTDPAQRLKTYAYPTAVTDPEGFTAWTWYNYDMGAATQVRTQKPNTTVNGTDGPVASSFYDAAGRVIKTTNSVNAANAEWVYDLSMTLVETYTTVSDESAQNPALRLYTAAALDGLGRVRGTARDFPGSTGPAPVGNFSAQITNYDAMGRAVFQSNPTEMRIANGTWTPAGDDANNGPWRGTSQTYDWKGRPKVTTNADGTQRSADYQGCGCAGGEVVTLTDEVGRRRKVYSDPYGRPGKTEVLTWNGSVWSVYSTAVTAYDGLDRVASVRQYQGEEQSGVYREAAFAYDGYGRLQSRHLPEQDAGTSTVYTYYADDTTHTVTDARGAVATYSYDGRHLPSGVAYTAPTGIAPSPSVTYGYDAAGNRTSMTQRDGSDNVVGSVSYTYDSLSRLKFEARQFPGLPGTFTLGYDYTLAGQLSKVADVTAGTSFTYNVDDAGRTTSITSTGFGASAPLVSAAHYRASGALKAASYGNGTSVSLSYDARGLTTHYGVDGVTRDGQYGPPFAHGSDFQYYADGRVKYASDLFTDRLVYGSYRMHDRAYTYDHVGRLYQAFSGHEANQFVTGLDTNQQGVGGAYSQTYGYDVWNAQTSRTGRFWTVDDNSSESYAAGTGRHAAPWEYDADGRFVSRNEPAPNELPCEPLRQTYDAAGRPSQTTQKTSWRDPVSQNLLHIEEHVNAKTYDGDGSVMKEEKDGGAVYYLRSSVLGGQAVAEYDSSGARADSFVVSGGGVVAHKVGNLLVWRQVNPVTGDEMETDAAGAVTGKEVLDPAGVAVGDADPFEQPAGGTGGDESGMTQAQMNARYAALLPPWLGGGTPSQAPCRLERMFMVGCGTLASLQATGLVAAVASPSAAMYGSKQLRFTGTRWHDEWEPCDKGDVCSRNVGYFEDDPDSGGVSGVLVAPQDADAPLVSTSKPGVCSIEIRVSGPKSPGNNLDFFIGDQKLGPVTRSSPSYATWNYQIEIRGTVNGDVSKWYLGQRVTTTNEGQAIDADSGITYDIQRKVTRDQPDTFEPGLTLQQPKGQSQFFAIDAPGYKKWALEPDKPVDKVLWLNQTQRFYTYIERGGKRCGVKWSLTTSIVNGQAVVQYPSPGHH